nr:helix-turn-helix transcriptional regulator [Thiomicrorhabdus marina]
MVNSGFVKQPFGEFSNFFLDSIISQNDFQYRDLRVLANLSRDEMAKIAGISPETIRRYENDMSYQARVPKWYYILLRLVNGDLSFYGDKWTNAKIQNHDRKLKTSYSQKAVVPMEMVSSYNRAALNARHELREEQAKSKQLQAKVEFLENELTQSRIQNEQLSQRVAQLENRKRLIDERKIIPLFSHQ